MEDKKIAERLRLIRTEHNLKQDDIARVLGIDRSAYSGYEIGRTRISVRNLCRLADIYNISLSALIGRQEKDEVVRVRTGNVAMSVDPIALLEREEQLLLMYYRLSDDAIKEQILNNAEQLCKENENYDCDESEC